MKRKTPPLPMEKVTLTTSDGITLAGDYYKAPGTKGALLLHMMPKTRTSWREFAPTLEAHGYHVLAIDLRGHGESAGGPNGYQGFTDSDHRKSIRDLEAGVAFLKEKGVDEVALMGASIGANAALWYGADHPEIKEIVLFSAGLNYRGIETEPLVQKLRSPQRVFFVSSEDDVRSGGDNVAMNRRLVSLLPSGIESRLLVYRHAGHGTDMFGKENPDLSAEILSWIGGSL